MDQGKSKSAILWMLTASSIAGYAQSFTATNNLRIVNGKIYNAATATNWTNLHGNLVETVQEGIIIGTTDVSVYWYDGGNKLGTRKALGKKHLIKNHPEQSTLTTKDLVWVRAMRVGTTNYGSETIAVYDCGRQLHHRDPYRQIGEQVYNLTILHNWAEQSHGRRPLPEWVIQYSAKVSSLNRDLKIMSLSSSDGSETFRLMNYPHMENLRVGSDLDFCAFKSGPALLDYGKVLTVKEFSTFLERSRK